MVSSLQHNWVWNQNWIGQTNTWAKSHLGPAKEDSLDPGRNRICISAIWTCRHSPSRPNLEKARFTWDTPQLPGESDDDECELTWKKRDRDKQKQRPTCAGSWGSFTQEFYHVHHKVRVLRPDFRKPAGSGGCTMGDKGRLKQWRCWFVWRFNGDLRFLLH